MKNTFYLIIGGILFLSFQSCSDKIDETIHDYSTEEYEIISQYLNLPRETDDFTLVTNGGNFNPPGERRFHKATLGRVLFYDKLLSKDESTSCASCHKQENAFADNARFSEGIGGQIGTRNSLPLGNTIGFVRYYGTDLLIPSGQFSWDESMASINDQSRAAITNPIEMDHDMAELTDIISQQDYYQVLFKKVYGNAPISEDQILDALTEFVNSFSSRESKFDEGIDGLSSADIPFSNFSNSENNGKFLFNTNCSSCHDTRHNAIIESDANNGLDLVYEDKGMGAKFSNPAWNGRFKVPSLRNIELTGPYMHDGRFATLEEVVEHYSTGIKDHPNLDGELKHFGQAKKFNFTDSEKQDLVAYLKTLTDTEFIRQEKWSNPFKS